jgi:hypothetical protein
VTGIGYVQIRALCTNGQALPCPAAGDQEDISIDVALQGARCQTISGGCIGAVGYYFGKVLFDIPFRIVDHRFDSSIPYSTWVETGMVDYPFTFGAQCSAGNCNVNTSLEAIIPNATTVKEGARQSFDILRFLIYDGGANGDLGITPFPTAGACPPACTFDDNETVFLRTGVFAP